MFKKIVSTFLLCALLIAACLSITSCEEGKLTLGTYETTIGGIVDRFVFTEEGFEYTFDDMEYHGTYLIKWGAFRDTIQLNFDFTNLTEKESLFAQTLTGYEKPVSFEVGTEYIIISDIKYKHKS